MESTPTQIPQQNLHHSQLTPQPGTPSIKRGRPSSKNRTYFNKIMHASHKQMECIFLWEENV